MFFTQQWRAWCWNDVGDYKQPSDSNCNKTWETKFAYLFFIVYTRNPLTFLIYTMQFSCPTLFSCVKYTVGFRCDVQLSHATVENYEQRALKSKCVRVCAAALKLTCFWHDHCANTQQGSVIWQFLFSSLKPNDRSCYSLCPSTTI